MTQYIPKSALVAEIKKYYEEYLKRAKIYVYDANYWMGKADAYRSMMEIIDALEVKDPYEQCVQYDSIKAGIQAHAETYSFNIESELFNQLTEAQQKLWRKEIEEACISGGEMGVELARDQRYKENLEVKEVDLEKEIQDHIKECLNIKFPTTDVELIKKDVAYTARKFFKLGLKSKIMTPELQQRIGVLKMEFWTGLQTFEEIEMTLSDAYNQGVDDILEELGLKAQKGEEV